MITAIKIVFIILINFYQIIKSIDLSFEDILKKSLINEINQ